MVLVSQFVVKWNPLHRTHLHTRSQPLYLGPFTPPTSFGSKTWDEKWLQLYIHYFSCLTWPDPANPPSHPNVSQGVSFVELMMDLCITFQVRVPINLAVYKNQRFINAPKIPRNSAAVYHLPTRSDGQLLPPEVITQTSLTFIRCFDFLNRFLQLTPWPKECLRSLSTFGFTNAVPSIKVRPTLLSGSRVRQFLESLIIPRVRILKISYRIPHVPPRTLPSCFPPDF